MGYVETTLEIREMLVALARRYAFRELAYLLGGGATGMALSQRDLARIQQLCAYGKRLIELDTEDLDEANAAIGATTDTTFAKLVGTELVPGADRRAGRAQPRAAGAAGGLQRCAHVAISRCTGCCSR